MLYVDFKRCVMYVMVGSLFLAATVSAKEREPRNWNATFIYGSTVFYGSDPHRTLGASYRMRLSNRLSVEPEFRHMSLPDRSYESSRGRSEYKHSDIMAAVHLVYDFRDEAKARVIPYVSVGAGWVQMRDERTRTKFPMESSIPIFPAPSSAATTETIKTADNWLWIGSAFGVRVLLPGGFFISPEVRVGGGKPDLSASAVIKAGIGF
jgi:hypothetical protein